MSNTIHLHRVLSAPPEKVFRAFIDAEAMAKWLPPHGFTCQVHLMEPRVGGTYKMSFTNFSTSKGHSFGGKYIEMIPGKKLKYTEKFADPNLPGEMQTTIEFTKVMCGTDLKISQEGLPEMIPVEMCYLGWQQSLNNLAQLVEPNIPE